ncbi:MAG TPA: hypothetical protein VMZ03_00435 [Chitinophagaceae bacterium]|nr:hypothetical protein [Chitinophagaceae bacterium]
MKKAVFILALFSSFSALAQKVKFADGFIITKTNDTLRGLVYWKKNSTQYDNLLYKRTETDEPRQFSWEELKYAYNKHAEKAVLVKRVRRSLEYVDPADFIIKLVDSSAVQTIPLTAVYIGHRLSLYEFFDKVPFFFIYDGEKMLQLIQKYRYLTDNEKKFFFQKAPRYYTFNEYRGLLRNYYDFTADKKMKYLLDELQYDEVSLHTFISKMDKKLK